MIKLFIHFYRRRAAAIVLFLTAFVIFTNLVKAQTASTHSFENPKASSSKDSSSANERTEIFEQVWNIINEKYYDASFHGVDWRAVRALYKPQIEKAASEQDFYALLDKMVGELRDSHTRVYSPSQREARKTRRSISAGIVVREVEGKPVIVSVAPDSEAERAGIKTGIIVSEINNKSVEEALVEARREVGTSSSERSTQMRAFSKLLSGEPDAEIKLVLIAADGKRFPVAFKRRAVKSAPQFEARVLPSGFAYLKFNQFLPEMTQQVEAALQKFKTAPGLILDLRNNGGGDGETGLQIAGYFFDDEISVARLVTRTGKPPVPEMPMLLKAGKKGRQIYSKPLVILVNEGTASTAELITSAMQEHNRAKVVGTQSCGCVLGILNYKELKGGGDLTISEFGFVTSKGRTLEGNGITPDKPVKILLRDIHRERDATLAEAAEILSSLLP